MTYAYVILYLIMVNIDMMLNSPTTYNDQMCVYIPYGPCRAGLLLHPSSVHRSLHDNIRAFSGWQQSTLLVPLLPEGKIDLS